MPTLAIVCGVILIVLGIVGYVATGQTSITALIPAFFGLALAILGAVANAAEGLRKHLMHLAVGAALTGFIATSIRVIPRIGELAESPAVISQAIMAVVCLLFVILAIRSFAAARRKA